MGSRQQTEAQSAEPGVRVQRAGARDQPRDHEPAPQQTPRHLRQQPEHR